MKGKYVRLILSFAVVCLAVTALTGLREDPAERAVKELIEERTAVMENVLRGKITRGEGLERLVEIERDDLYARDANILREYEDTDCDRVRDMNIISLERKSSMYETFSFKAEIERICLDHEGEYISREEYHIGAVREGDEYRLISMNIK